jgi:hypothetical protein
LYARFATAWSALAYAGLLPGGHPVGEENYLRGGPGAEWWIRCELPLETARELICVASGDIYLPSGEVMFRDRGWGSPTDQGEPVTLSDLRNVPLLELVRVAGLNPRPARPLREAVLLLPGHLVAGITRRALDLGLEISYRSVTLAPLFNPENPARACYELSLAAGADACLPAFLIAALDRDPAVLVCRHAADRLLVQHQMAAPLSDRALASLTGDATWVLADVAYGCAQLTPIGEAQDGAALVRRGADHELADAGPAENWTESGEAPSRPVPPVLTLVRARMTGVPVDAALLDDQDLGSLAFLLPGEPLADIAMLVRGRDRHLLTAPGGLLEQLPVGEPLYWLGPGSLYLPLGYRMQPTLPAGARRELFPADAATAIVVLRQAALRYDLTAREPVWTLWAGPLPPVELQVPDSAVEALGDLDQELTPAESTARPHSLPRPASGQPAQRFVVRPIEERGPAATARPRTWRDEAYEAELAGKYAVAAELHLKHDDPLRAARLYERAAQSR